MKTVKVEDRFLAVNSGQVAISAAQAKTRRHALAPLKVEKDGAGVYEVRQPIQFKLGEVFGFSGEVGKGGVASDPDAEAKAAAAQARTEEEMRRRIEAQLRRELAADFEKRLKDLGELHDGIVKELEERHAKRIADLTAELAAARGAK